MSPLDSELAGFALAVTAAVIAFGALQSLIEIAQLVLAWRALRARPPVAASHLWRRYVTAAPAVAVIAPAFNESRTIAQSVRSLLLLEYPAFEVIVVNDGSSDGTLDVLTAAFGLERLDEHADICGLRGMLRGLYRSRHHPRLLVADKANGGKADALNAGIALARAPLVCCIDADSLLEKDALIRAVQPFLDDPERVIAVGGTVRLANGCKVEDGRVVEIGLPRTLLGLFQTVEYLRAFLMARLAWSRAGALTIVSGAFGLFRRDAVLEAGGYRLGTVGEDMELVMRLHRHFRDAGRDYRIAYIPEPVCWTEAPENLRDLANQRRRWHRGALETFFLHAGMTGRRRYGRIGSLGMAQIAITDVLGPVAEILGYLLIPVFCLLGLMSWTYFAAFLALRIGFGIAISVAALALEEAQLRRFPRPRDLVILTLAAVAENFGYRQLSNLWRIGGMWQFMSGATAWGAMARQGFSAPAGACGSSAAQDARPLATKGKGA